MTETMMVPLELRASSEPHTLEGLCVPYGQVSMRAGYPQGERFVAGAFAEACGGASKIRLTDSHDETGRRPAAVAAELRDTEEGLWGRFRFYNTPEGRGAYENVVEETYGGLSVGFLAEAERRDAAGVREVVRARLFHVSLVDEPAYADARVLAVRSALPDVSKLLDWEAPKVFPEPPNLSTLVFSRAPR